MKSILLKASAGSGKTTRLTEEVFERILIGGKFIAALTFTRAATTEMRSRIMKEIASKKGVNYSKGREVEVIALLVKTQTRQ